MRCGYADETREELEHDDGQVGSHWQFKHPDRAGRITVPHPNRDIKLGTVA